MEAVLRRAEHKLAVRLAFELASLEAEFDDCAMEEKAKMINSIARTLKLAKELTNQRQADSKTSEEENLTAMEFRAELSRRIEALGNERTDTISDRGSEKCSS